MPVPCSDDFMSSMRDWMAAAEAEDAGARRQEVYGVAGGNIEGVVSFCFDIAGENLCSLGSGETCGGRRCQFGNNVGG